MKIGRLTPLAMFLVAGTLIALGYNLRGETAGTLLLLAGALMSLGGAFAVISRGRTARAEGKSAADLIDPTKGE